MSPLMWADEMAILNEVNMEMFKTMDIDLTKIVVGVAIGLEIVAGFLLFPIRSFIIYRTHERNIK